MTEVQPQQCITTAAATAAALMGITPPTGCQDTPLAAVMDKAAALWGDGSVQRVVAVLPDAVSIGVWLRHAQLLSRVLDYSPLQIPLYSVLPPKTPVCYASIFSGGQPDYHGIKRYEKPVLTCDTLFDAMLRAGRRPAIVACEDCSMDRIFRNRAMDYFTEPDDVHVHERALELLQADRYDFLAVYFIAADRAQHRTTPYAPEFAEAIAEVIGYFQSIAQAFARSAADKRRALLFLPDHGGHINPETGRGDHCLDIPDDMYVYHCYGLAASK